MSDPTVFQSIVVFADGACTGNPGPGGWGAIIIFPEGKVRELGGRDPSTTNNRMELTAVGKALRALEGIEGRVVIYTDSTYVIRGITQWIWGWKKKGWKTREGEDVANVEFWKRLDALARARKDRGGIDWRYVRGHSGVPGNERVDEIAVAFTKRQPVELFEGPLLKYSVAVHDLPEGAGELPEIRPREEKPKAIGYLSLVHGKLERHGDWRSCEARVKGVSGAKFKKVTSPEEESEIAASWGFDLPDEGSE